MKKIMDFFLKIYLKRACLDVIKYTFWDYKENITMNPSDTENSSNELYLLLSEHTDAVIEVDKSDDRLILKNLAEHPKLKKSKFLKFIFFNIEIVIRPDEYKSYEIELFQTDGENADFYRVENLEYDKWFEEDYPGILKHALSIKSL